MIPTPLHVLGRISPIVSPFFPVFCAFSPSRRGGSNEPKTGTQGQETASRAPKHRFAGLANSGCPERMAVRRRCRCRSGSPGTGSATRSRAREARRWAGTADRLRRCGCWRRPGRAACRGRRCCTAVWGSGCGTCSGSWGSSRKASARSRASGAGAAGAATRPRRSAPHSRPPRCQRRARRGGGRSGRAAAARLPPAGRGARAARGRSLACPLALEDGLN